MKPAVAVGARPLALPNAFAFTVVVDDIIEAGLRRPDESPWAPSRPACSGSPPPASRQMLTAIEPLKHPARRGDRRRAVTDGRGRYFDRR